jgi:type IV secretion system protein VirB10
MSEGCSESAEAPATAPKEDPESLVLRGRPRSVIRFRRGLIIALAATATAALAGLAWIALEPPSLRITAESDSPKLAARGAPEGLADAPATYADVPQLGPPLPGDLGRPILEQQRKLADDRARWGEPSAHPDAERRAAEEQRLAGQVQAARAAPVLVRLGTAANAAPEPSSAGSFDSKASDTVEPSRPSEAKGAEERGLTFAHSVSGTIDAHALVGLASPWMLSAGTVIPASLITGLNSDLPGTVIAQVTQQVRDSATGTAVLIPQGARLIGRYDSDVGYGQRRLLLVWERLVFPDGSSLELGKMQATDSAGYSGLGGKVDNHEWRLLKGILLSTVLGIGSELSLGGGDSELARSIERSVQQDGVRTGDQLVSRSLDVQPTLTVRPGWPVRAILHSDLVLKPWRG